MTRELDFEDGHGTFISFSDFPSGDQEFDYDNLSEVDDLISEIRFGNYISLEENYISLPTHEYEDPIKDYSIKGYDELKNAFPDELIALQLIINKIILVHRGGKVFQKLYGFFLNNKHYSFEIIDNIICFNGEKLIIKTGE